MRPCRALRRARAFLAASSGERGERRSARGAGAGQAAAGAQPPRVLRRRAHAALPLAGAPAFARGGGARARACVGRRACARAGRCSWCGGCGGRTHGQIGTTTGTTTPSCTASRWRASAWARRNVPQSEQRRGVTTSCSAIRCFRCARKARGRTRCGCGSRSRWGRSRW